VGEYALQRLLKRRGRQLSGRHSGAPFTVVAVGHRYQLSTSGVGAREPPQQKYTETHIQPLAVTAEELSPDLQEEEYVMPKAPISDPMAEAWPGPLQSSLSSTRRPVSLLVSRVNIGSGVRPV
jgi:hypothetical protein